MTQSIMQNLSDFINHVPTHIQDGGRKHKIRRRKMTKKKKRKI